MADPIRGDVRGDDDELVWQAAPPSADTVPLAPNDGPPADDAPAAPQPPPRPPRQPPQATQRRHGDGPRPQYHDVHSATVRHLQDRFKSALAGLLGINLLLYVLESTIAQFSPTGPDMVLLMGAGDPPQLLGWFAQDLLRYSSLGLFVKLSLASLAIDTVGFITSFVAVVVLHYSGWIAVALVLFYGVEFTYKISAIVHAKNLQRELGAPTPATAELEMV